MKRHVLFLSLFLFHSLVEPAHPAPSQSNKELRQLMKVLITYLREKLQFLGPFPRPPAEGTEIVQPASPDFEDPDKMDFHENDKRQFDDYGHMRFGKRADFDEYGHSRFGRSAR